jgi:hypothetical protein
MSDTRRLARAGGLRYSRGRAVPGIVAMIAIGTILIFLVVFAALNQFEFGRID